MILKSDFIINKNAIKFQMLFFMAVESTASGVAVFLAGWISSNHQNIITSKLTNAVTKYCWIIIDKFFDRKNWIGCFLLCFSISFLID